MVASILMTDETKCINDYLTMLITFWVILVVNFNSTFIFERAYCFTLQILRWSGILEEIASELLNAVNIEPSQNKENKVRHLKIECICLHLNISPSMTFWAISSFPRTITIKGSQLICIRYQFIISYMIHMFDMRHVNFN